LDHSNPPIQLLQLEDELLQVAVHVRAARQEAALLQNPDRPDVVTSDPRAQRARPVMLQERRR
jgi:hypothetical protein